MSRRPNRSAFTSVFTPAFTLIELLVSVAIIAVLLSILAPALGAARSAARTAQSASIQRQLAMGNSSYAEFSDDWLPGINTTGMRLSRALRGPNPQIIDAFSDIPTQDVDWMTASLGDADLPVERSARMAALFERYAAPALDRFSELYEKAYEPGPSGLDDMRAWLAEDTDRRLVATSYLMPIAFQLYGGSGSFVSNFGTNYYTRYGQYSPRFVPQTNDAIIGSGYRPTLPSIGSPSMKIANATGLRYYDTGDKITTNPAFAPARMGAFATWGAIYSGSESYGQQLEQESGQDRNETNGQQARLVYRHNGKIIATFFDGHTEMLGVEESHDPSLWYPKGSIMGNEGTSIVETAFNFVPAGDPIP